MLDEAQQRHPTRILSYCLMPNHWHFVLWPKEDGELTAFLRWLTHTHTMRWHAHHHTGGTGHLYQGRFKSFPVESDEHLLTVIRYVERNPLRANLVQRADQWRWCSVWRRRHAKRSILHAWPIPRPRNWLERLDVPLTDAELEAVRRSARRGRPFGGERWVKNTAVRLGLEWTLRPRGRPRKQPE